MLDELDVPLDLETAALAAQVSRRTVTRWIESGLLPVYEDATGDPGSPRRYVLERDLIEVEHERRAARRRGRPTRRVESAA